MEFIKGLFFIIYDKVGNVVKTFPPKENEKDSVTIEWDGTNEHGRIVGNGTYLAFLKGTSIIAGSSEVTTVSEKLRIGVRRY